MHNHRDFDERLLLTRRRLLQLGGGGTCVLSLGGLLQAQAATEVVRAAATSPKIKSCIVIFYYGGPSHIDTYDLKPQAPADVRGEFQPISTTVPGLFVCEHLPRMSRLMHKVALVRSMHHVNRLHDSASTEVLTGRQSPTGDREEFAPIKQFFPCHGSTVSYLRRDRAVDVPHAALPFVFHNVVDVPCQGGGFLGAAFDPLQINVDVETKSYRAGQLALPEGQPPTVLSHRRSLLAALERDGTGSGVVSVETPPSTTRLPTETTPDPIAHTAALRQWRLFYDKAFQLLGSEALRRALDLSQEDQRTRDRYGFGPAPVAVGEGGGGGNGAEMGVARQMRGQNLLLARRLVEAGVPFVNVYDFRQQGQNWDAHFKNFNQHKTHLLPLADQSLSALLKDLEDRGLLDSTLVVAMGEFGRTPKINGDGGRDHWPDCYTILLAGGGVNGGTVFGSSDRIGAYPATDPVSPGDLAATIFWRFGLDPLTEVHDQTGRPWRIADGQPVTKLFG